MSTSRIFASHGLVILLFLPACHTWRPVVIAAQTGYQRAGNVRIASKATSNDSLISPARRSAAVSRAAGVFNRAWVDGDSLFAVRSRATQPVAIAVADVRSVEERRFSGRRTSLLMASVIVGTFVGLIGLIAASPGGAGL